MATKATWEGTVIAATDTYEEVEGNIYFPPASVDRQYVQPSEETSTCPWKGLAKYYNLVVGDKVNAGAAWYYPEPKPAASKIKDHVAFWKGVKIEIAPAR